MTEKFELKMSPGQAGKPEKKLAHPSLEEPPEPPKEKPPPPTEELLLPGEKNIKYTKRQEGLKKVREIIEELENKPLNFDKKQ